MADAAALAREWVEFAFSDCEMAVRATSKSPKLYWQALFHSQQAVEKMLKAFLMYQGQIFDKTHDLGKLCRLCASIEQPFPIEWRNVDWLTEYAVDFRYPGVEQPSEDDAQRGVALARTVLEKLLELLPPACAPSGKGENDGGDRE